ncbi:MAG: signal peptidase II [Leptospirales bacterium]
MNRPDSTTSSRRQISTPPLWRFYMLIAGGVFILDQLTKYAIQRILFEGESLTVIPHFFNIVSIRNTGIVFGLFQDPNGWIHRGIFIVLTIAAAILILYYSRRKKEVGGGEFYPLALILGGAIGNLSDRILKGKVVDFLDFSFLGHHWPAFNVADSAIVIGVSILLVFQLTAPIPSSSPSDKPHE